LAPYKRCTAITRGRSHTRTRGSDCASLPAVVVVAGVPPEAAIFAFFNGVSHAFANFVSPELLGCTPSTVSVASLYPVQQSTTVMDEAEVALLAAHAGMALLRLITPCVQVGQLLGFIGVI
jgi:TctA family transporter